MSRAAVSELIAAAAVLRPTSCARGTSGLGREMCVYANVTGETNLLRAAAGGEVVGMAETAGRSWYG